MKNSSRKSERYETFIGKVKDEWRINEVEATIRRKRNKPAELHIKVILGVVVRRLAFAFRFCPFTNR